MTEKRFGYIEVTDEVDEHIIDYSTEPHFEYYTLKGATDKLNELNNEKEWLEMTNKDLASFIISKGYTLKDFIEYIGQFRSVGVNNEG